MRSLRELLLGARMALAGGVSGWLRASLTALGVGLGVALLLVAVSMPNAIASRGDRMAARDDVSYAETPSKSDTTILVGFADTTFHDRPIRGRLLQPDGAHPPVPPGLAEVPRLGELAVSPALARLLASPDAALLRERLDYPVVAVIGDEGLSGPTELAFYLGVDDLEGTLRLTSFGQPRTPSLLDPILSLLVVVGVVVLLLPVGLFVAAAIRFGGEARDRRLAGVRLLGADARMARRIAAGEALASSALGLLTGAAMFLIGRSFVGRIELLGLSLFPADIRPDPLLATALVVAVPAAAVGVTLFSLRGVVIEPLGVARRAGDARRRLWWRLLVPALGVALLLPSAGDLSRGGGRFTMVPVSAGLVLVLVGVAALLPWAVQATVRLIRGGPVAWQLAVRRLRLDSSTSARTAMGVAVAVAGAIGLQTLFISVESMFVSRTGADLDRANVQTYLYTDNDWDDVRAVEAALRGTTGVEAAFTWVSASATVPETPASARDSDPTVESRQVTIAACAVLREKANLDSCEEGDVFVLRASAENNFGPAPEPGTTVTFGYGPENGTRWTVPATAQVVDARPDPAGRVTSGLLLTPSVLPVEALDAYDVFSYVDTDEADRDAVDRVRNTMWTLSRIGETTVLTAEVKVHEFAMVRRGLLAGAAVTLVLIGASLLVGLLEQLRERRRVLASLVAFGTRRRTLAWSILWQTAIPMALGLLLAMAAGVAIGAMLLRIIDQPVTIDWPNLAFVSGIAAFVVLAVTALSLPLLWRIMRADGLRME